MKNCMERYQRSVETLSDIFIWGRWAWSRNFVSDSGGPRTFFPFPCRDCCSFPAFAKSYVQGMSHKSKFFSNLIKGVSHFEQKEDNTDKRRLNQSNPVRFLAWNKKNEASLSISINFWSGFYNWLSLTLEMNLTFQSKSLSTLEEIRLKNGGKFWLCALRNLDSIPDCKIVSNFWDPLIASSAEPLQP